MDPNQHVKSALASVIMGLSPMLGKDKYVWLMFLFSFTVVFHGIRLDRSMVRSLHG